MESESKKEEVGSYKNTSAKKARLQSMLSALLDDPILSDVPKKPSLSDVDTLIHLELGSAMRISVVRMDNTSFDVAVLNSATVKDLKLAIRKKTEEIEQAQMGHRHISWRHVWANFCLAYNNEKLMNDDSLLSEYGIRNNSKLLANQLDPLTEQQLVGICNLQQSSQQAEDALSQGMEQLQQSLSETLAGSLGPSRSSGNVANYMGQMAMAMGKLGTLENFLRQADNLRQQTLQQMIRILTTRQAARALLAIHDYFSRLRALSSLWLARPRE